jgi:hypothetical protein
MYGEFIWWTGVVEDRVDPLKLGRCRVRILGYHSDKKGVDLIPTNTLPWATPSQPITSAAMNGVGTTPMGPVEGTWVFGFFRDGKESQDPVMIGTFGGIPEAGPDPTLGFNDPKGIYPQALYLNEPDTNRLGRGSGKLPVGKSSGENAPSLEHKRSSRQKDVPDAVLISPATATGTSFCLDDLLCSNDGAFSPLDLPTGSFPLPRPRRFVSGSFKYNACGYIPFGSLNPSVGSGPASGIPPNVPIITGSCDSFPSRKKPKTQVPSTGPIGVVPTPFIAADVIGCDGVAHGKVLVGIRSTPFLSE